MSDFAIFSKTDGYDIKSTGGQPTMTGGLTPAILISLLTKSKQDGSISYWYDSISNKNFLTTGNFLNILNNPNTEENRNKIPGIVKQDLKWMIDQGIIERIETDIEFVNNETLIITISIFEPEELTLKFKANWDQQKIELIGE